MGQCEPLVVLSLGVDVVSPAAQEHARCTPWEAPGQRWLRAAAAAIHPRGVRLLCCLAERPLRGKMRLVPHDGRIESAGARSTMVCCLPRRPSPRPSASSVLPANLSSSHATPPLDPRSDAPSILLQSLVPRRSFSISLCSPFIDGTHPFQHTSIPAPSVHRTSPAARRVPSSTSPVFLPRVKALTSSGVHDFVARERAPATSPSASQQRLAHLPPPTLKRRHGLSSTLGAFPSEGTGRCVTLRDTSFKHFLERGPSLNRDFDLDFDRKITPSTHGQYVMPDAYTTVARFLDPSTLPPSTLPPSPFPFRLYWLLSILSSTHIPPVSTPTPHTTPVLARILPPFVPSPTKSTP